MKRHVLPPALLAATLAMSLSAHAAALTRTFVSSTGVDTNPCTIAQPCATFAAAYAAVANNGIIAALDPGKYGPLTNITTGVTINGNGWAAITAPAQGTGIAITAGTANVALNGLEVDGALAAYNGIVLNSAGTLTVTNCTLQNFTSINDGITGTAILLRPSSGAFDFSISNTTASQNGFAGISYFPATGTPNAIGVIDHVAANGNQYGMYFDMSNAENDTTIITVGDSVTGYNNAAGILAQNPVSGMKTFKLSIDSVNASHWP